MLLRSKNDQINYFYQFVNNLWLESSGIQSLMMLFSFLNFRNPIPQSPVISKHTAMYNNGLFATLFPCLWNRESSPPRINSWTENWLEVKRRALLTIFVRHVICDFGCVSIWKKICQKDLNTVSLVEIRHGLDYV